MTTFDQRSLEFVQLCLAGFADHSKCDSLLFTPFFFLPAQRRNCFLGLLRSRLSNQQHQLDNWHAGDASIKANR